MLVTSIRLRIEKKTHHASGKKCFGFSAGFEPATLCS